MASRLTSMPPSATPPNAPLTHVESQNRPTEAVLTTLSSETSQTQSNSSMTAVRPDLQKEVDAIKSMAGGVLHILVKQDQEIKEQRKENQQLRQKVLDLENQNKEKNSLISQMRNEQIEEEKRILRSATIFINSSKEKPEPVSTIMFKSIMYFVTTPDPFVFTASRKYSAEIDTDLLSELRKPTAAELLEYMEKNPGTSREEALRALLIAKLKRAGENLFFPTEEDVHSAMKLMPDSIGPYPREQAMRTLVNQHIERLKEKTGKKD